MRKLGYAGKRMNELEPANSLRVLVVAAYPSARAGLRAMLDGHEGNDPITVVGEVATLEAPGEFAAIHADVVVAEFEGQSSGDVFPVDLPAVLIASEASAYMALGPLSRPGAYLLRDAGPEELAAAAWAVARGLTVMDPAVAALMTAGEKAERHPGNGSTTLTDREHAVLDLVALGLPNKGIARQLGISEHTVKFHVGAILGKLGAASRAEAVALAARQGLLAL